MTTKDVSLKGLLDRLHKMHDPNSRAVVHEIEALMREADAWKFKYDNAMARIEEFEKERGEGK